MTTLYYIHDPMCSWCWGGKQVIESLLNNLPAEVQVEKLLGGLASDSDAIMPTETQAYIKQTWQRIADKIPGVDFNFDFWTKCTPKRSTYPACRAVIAARMQDPEAADKMISAIQQAYYQQARNPSEIITLVEIAAEIGLDADRFHVDLLSVSVDQMLQKEITFAREIGVNSYPSLVLEVDGGYWPVAIDYLDPTTMLNTINDIMSFQ